MKKIARKKVCWRPFEAEGKAIKKKSARKGTACIRHKKHNDKDFFYVTKGFNNHAMRSLKTSFSEMKPSGSSRTPTGAGIGVLTPSSSR